MGDEGDESFEVPFLDDLLEGRSPIPVPSISLCQGKSGAPSSPPLSGKAHAADRDSSLVTEETLLNTSGEGSFVRQEQEGWFGAVRLGALTLSNLSSRRGMCFGQGGAAGDEARDDDQGRGGPSWVPPTISKAWDNVVAYPSNFQCWGSRTNVASPSPEARTTGQEAEAPPSRDGIKSKRDKHKRKGKKNKDGDSRNWDDEEHDEGGEGGVYDEGDEPRRAGGLSFHEEPLVARQLFENSTELATVAEQTLSVTPPEEQMLSVTPQSEVGEGISNDLTPSLAPPEEEGGEAGRHYSFSCDSQSTEMTNNTGRFSSQPHAFGAAQKDLTPATAQRWFSREEDANEEEEFARARSSEVAKKAKGEEEEEPRANASF